MLFYNFPPKIKRQAISKQRSSEMKQKYLFFSVLAIRLPFDKVHNKIKLKSSTTSIAFFTFRNFWRDNFALKKYCFLLRVLLFTQMLTDDLSPANINFYVSFRGVNRRAILLPYFIKYHFVKAKTCKLDLCLDSTPR